MTTSELKDERENISEDAGRRVLMGAAGAALTP